MANELIYLKNISKSFDGQMVLDDLTLYIKENEFLTLLGPSGCGKTTTLRIIGGFCEPDQGTVLFEGKDITHMPPNKRQLNTVFQKYALFTHMNIEENIAFGLKIKGKSRLTLWKREISSIFLRLVFVSNKTPKSISKTTTFSFSK